MQHERVGRYCDYIGGFVNNLFLKFMTISQKYQIRKFFSALNSHGYASQKVGQWQRLALKIKFLANPFVKFKKYTRPVYL